MKLILSISIKDIFPLSIISINRGKGSEGLNEFAKQNCLNEFNYLYEIIDNDEMHYKRLDYKNNFCRYQDIRPYKDNRVKISSPNGYINASWVDMPYTSYFIATQGPLKSTSEDFWEMCFNYDVKIIIMLCKLQENNMEKCYNYWNTYLKKYQIIKTSNEIKNEEGLIIRNFQIINKNDYVSKDIVQIHLMSWDDHTAPVSNYEKIIKIINFILENKKNSPVVVHCSAGVGRTGTFISLFNLYNEITQQLNKKEIHFSIMNLVRKLKEMRMHLVENEDQYIFLYEFCNILLNQVNK